MFKRKEPNKVSPYEIGQFPHCDQRILHAPSECEFCDKYQMWQGLRQAWGIAFTGYIPEGTELPCPADHARGEAHAKWPGSGARPAEEKS
jgi:hypothetical protein